ncbi:MAG: four helix bundle protein [Crocinitomicaceae bacterium]|nr:four helix bundle protein [Crocinitomicaceae bacterium]
MKIERFEDVLSWQKSQDLAVDIYKLFNELKDYSFKDQVCRASVSISNNIAEGFERYSNKELVRFLFISNGSTAEVKSMLYLAYRLKYIDLKTRDDLIKKCEEISRIIKGFIRSIK